MKILIRNSDSVVVYAGNDLALSDNGLRGDGWFSPHFTTANSHIDDADLPPNWRGAVWTRIGGVWAVSDTAAHNNTMGAQRAARWAEIKSSRDARKGGGVLVGGKWFHTDTDSRIQQLGLVMMGAAVPAVDWKTMDGTKTPMSQTLAGQIFQAVATLDMTLFAAAETHRAAMEASDNPAGYDFSAGWPAHF
jgi:hypothetical protein